MKVFIRADGGEVIGLGHVMRMLVLAKELSKDDEVIFICKSSNSENRLKKININNYLSFKFENDRFKAGIKKIIENEFEAIMISEKYIIEDIIKLQNEYKANLIITDSYDVNGEYFNKLKPYFKLTGYMDDVNKCRMNVDFIINQNINAEDIEYEHNVNKDTILYLGTKYCLLRDEFRENYTKRQIKEKAEDVLLTLGGMDNNYNTIKVLKEIINFNVNIHVVIGSAFNKKLIEELCELSKKFCNVKLYENANMSAMMKKCDIAISACGSTLYELCAMNVPTIGIIIADNQEAAAKKMKENHLIMEIYYIDELKEGNFSSDFIKLINDKKLRSEIIDNQRNAVNVYGVKDLVYEINKL